MITEPASWRNYRKFLHVKMFVYRGDAVKAGVVYFFFLGVAVTAAGSGAVFLADLVLVSAP